MPEEAERAAILAASTAYSSRPDRARVVGDYAMATPQWSGWEGDEQYVLLFSSDLLKLFM